MNTELNILIVEDDLSYALELELLIEKSGYKCVGRVDTAEDAREMIRRFPVDIILLDIHLKGEVDGFQLAKELGTNGPFVIYITSYDSPESFERAQSLGLHAFLVKPVNQHTLFSTIDMAADHRWRLLDQQNEDSKPHQSKPLLESILVKQHRIYEKVALNDILYFRLVDGVVHLKTKDRLIHIKNTLSQVSSLLQLPYFGQIHRSCIINLNHLKSILPDTNEVVMENGETLTISARRRKELEAKWIILTS